MAQDEKKMSLALDILGTIYHVIAIYGTHVGNDNISWSFFLVFQKFWFSGLSGG